MKIRKRNTNPFIIGRRIFYIGAGEQFKVLPRKPTPERMFHFNMRKRMRELITDK